MARSLSFRHASARCLALIAFVASCAGASAATGVEFKSEADRVSVRVDGELLTELRFNAGPKPYLYPLLGPGGVALTRNYPMSSELADEEKDHPHHRSVWFTHGSINGVDFWAEGPKMGRVVQTGILDSKSGPDSGYVRTANRWETPDGKVVLTDETTIRAVRSPLGRVLDYQIVLKASQGADLTFGDTKEGTMAIRLAESMRLKPNKHFTGKPTGHILQSTGVKDGETWGKRAAWTAYSGPVDGKTMSVVMFDHPKNPRYPTWWHVRDYGLFAANPFGIHDFEKKPAGTGDLVVKAGESVTFRYRLLLATGDIDPSKMASLASEFGGATP